MWRLFIDAMLGEGAERGQMLAQWISEGQPWYRAIRAGRLPLAGARGAALLKSLLEKAKPPAEPVLDRGRMGDYVGLVTPTIRRRRGAASDGAAGTEVVGDEPPLSVAASGAATRAAFSRSWRCLSSMFAALRWLIPCCRASSLIRFFRLSVTGRCPDFPSCCPRVTTRAVRPTTSSSPPNGARPTVHLAMDITLGTSADVERRLARLGNRGAVGTAATKQRSLRSQGNAARWFQRIPMRSAR